MLITPVLGITTQQSFGIAVAVVVAVGWLLYLAANIRKAKPEVGSEVELAANRKPYFDDEGLEGPRLDRVLTWGLISLALVGLGLPLYWLAEPGRQAGAIDDFDETFAARGEGLYATTAEGGFNCAGCHGGLLGGPVPYTFTDPDTGRLREVQWYAPSLNDVTLRMTDEQIRFVLVYGRPFSPMPAWGLEGGGPMNDQQINNLIAYLHSVTITPEEAQANNAARAAAELEELQGQDPGPTNQPATMAAALFNTNCARCHTLGYSYNEPQVAGGGALGPSLYNAVNQFPDREDHIGFVSEGAEDGERYGLNGQSSGRMPYFSQVLTPDQIAAIVDYERQLNQLDRGDLGDDGDDGGATSTSSTTAVVGEPAPPGPVGPNDADAADGQGAQPAGSGPGTDNVIEGDVESDS